MKPADEYGSCEECGEHEAPDHFWDLEWKGGLEGPQEVLVEENIWIRDDEEHEREAEDRRGNGDSEQSRENALKPIRLIPRSAEELNCGNKVRAKHGTKIWKYVLPLIHMLEIDIFIIGNHTEKNSHYRTCEKC